MLILKKLPFVILISFASLLAACGGSGNNASTAVVNQTHLYSSTNNAAGNNVVAFEIQSGGGLTQVGSFPTGGLGDADEGDFDGQSSIRVIGNHLLVVNAGELSTGVNNNGSISVFSIATNGLLTRVDQDATTAGVQNIDSNGIRPVSIDYHSNGTTTWVLVANQHSNPLCDAGDMLGSTNAAPATSLANCFDQNDQMLGNGTNGSLATSTARNLSLYTFANGVLTSLGTPATYNSPIYGGPSQVSFSPNGSMVAVTTWGIPHFTGLANTTFQSPSRTYLYDVNITGTTLSLQNERFFQQTGVSGSIGFSWSSDNQNIYVANFNIASNVANSSVTILNTQNSTNVFSSNGNSIPSGTAMVPGFGVEACWTWLNADNSLLTVPSFTANTVSTFLVNGTNLAHRQSLVRRGTSRPDTKDGFFLSNNQHLYVLGALETHTITVYDYDADNNLLTEQTNSPFLIPDSRPGGANVSATTHAYLGLAGYPAGYVGY